MASPSEPRSRLDKLLRLLHTGNDAARVAAAKQLARTRLNGGKKPSSSSSGPKFSGGGGGGSAVNELTDDNFD